LWNHFIIFNVNSQQSLLQPTFEYMSKTFIDAPSTVASFVLVEKIFPQRLCLPAGCLPASLARAVGRIN
jgi:hypothetical protein